MKNWSNPEIKNLGLELTEDGGGYIRNEQTGQEFHTDPRRMRIIIEIFGKWRWICGHDGTCADWSRELYDTPSEAWAALQEHMRTHHGVQAS